MTENEATEIIKQVPLFRYECELEKGRQSDLFKALYMAIQALEEIQKYRAIGTVEEHKDLKEKNTEKRFNIFESNGMRQFVCGCCDRPILTTDNYCSFCGQKLDWS